MKPMPLTESQREELARMLEQALAALGGDIESERKEARENVAARRDSGVQDRGEESFAGSVVAVDRAMLRQHQTERREVQAALARLREGSYGECVQCGEAVGYERLRIAPAAGRCLRCQERAEQA
jgi:RNA polymerase-binding transcription factor DksA